MYAADASLGRKWRGGREEQGALACLTMHGSTTSTFPLYSQYTSGALLGAYRAGPAHLRAAVSGLSREDLQAHPRPGKWSIIEITRHLTDGEVVGAGRIRSAWAEPGSNFIGYNQDRWAMALEYQVTDAD